MRASARPAGATGPVPAAPALTPAAVAYAFRELARRAGVPQTGRDGSGLESLGVTVRYGDYGSATRQAPAVVVWPAPAEEWSRLLGRPASSLESVPLASTIPQGGRMSFAATLPVLFRGSGSERGRPFARPEGSDVVFEADIIASTFFLLTRWEEWANPARDEHGRFPVEESVAFRQGFLDRPVVDEYALVFREWLRLLLPGWRPKERRFSILLSHDVDTVRPFGSLTGALRTLAGDLTTRRDLAAAGRTCSEALIQAVAPDRHPHWRGLELLAVLSRRHGVRSAFYFMAAEKSAHDSGYDPRSRRIRRLIGRLRGDGFELGFHPGYYTFDDPARLAEEKGRMDAVLGEARYGGRQHFLRFRVPDTWRAWEGLGLSYDSTLAFAKREGFRCGTCHPYRPFDFERDRELDLLEIPLIVMDGTLRQHRDLDPEEGRRRILELADTCRRVEGSFNLLWHNSSLHGEWLPWRRTYEQTVKDLAALEGRGSSEPEPVPSVPQETPVLASGPRANRARHRLGGGRSPDREGWEADSRLDPSGPPEGRRGR